MEFRNGLVPARELTDRFGVAFVFDDEDGHPHGPRFGPVEGGGGAST